LLRSWDLIFLESMNNIALEKTTWSIPPRYKLVLYIWFPNHIALEILKSKIEYYFDPN
jgi:hypothetical protein